ncbi:MAG: hypothetical protein QG622_2943 [Actinomycetota bacterium]|nr:hypothetical protein [Actinomycetota bacterium]
MAELEFLWKDLNSGGGGCPALYRTEGGYIVQGKRLDSGERAQLRDLAGDEEGVYVPANVLDRLTGRT